MFCYSGELTFRGTGTSLHGSGWYKYTYLDIGEHRVKAVRAHNLLVDIISQVMGKQVTIWGKRVLFVKILFAVEANGHRESMPFGSFLGTMFSYVFYLLPVGAAFAVNELLGIPAGLWVLYDFVQSCRLYLSPPTPSGTSTPTSP